MDEKEIRFIDLFGGIGGFRHGLEKAGGCRQEKELSKQGGRNTICKSNKRQYSFNCVWYCDKDKYAVQTYNKNFRENYEPTDITTVKPETIPDFDMLCAGFPCQAFSVAGKRKGFKDTRGTLFFEITRIAKSKKPPYLFLENVKGLLNHEKGKTFTKILQTLDELGYDTQWMVFNSKFFGVPQNRERVFIVGHLRNKSCRQVFPFTESYQEFNGMEQTTRKRRERMEDEVASAIDSNYWKGGRAGRSMVSMEHKKITERTGKYGNGYKTEGSFCLDSSSGRDLIIHPAIRRLTPVECERLQGFPDNWTDGVSDTQRYKQLGNAVTINVIQAIGEKILEII